MTGLTGLRVKLVTGDVRHLESFATASALFMEIQAMSRLGHSAFWIKTAERTEIDAMQIVEVGEPWLTGITETPGRYVAKVWDNTVRPGDPPYGVWDTHRDDWERDDGGMEKHDAENIAWNLNGETS